MTIPLTWNDPSFSGLVNSSPVEVQDGGTLSDYSTTDDGAIASVLLDGSATLNDVRINSDEGIRIGGTGNVTISNSYITTTGLPGDHADSIQAYVGGGGMGNVTITNTTIVASTSNQNSGMFIADGYYGTFTFNNVVFEGGPIGLRIAADGGAGHDDYVSLNNVYFVGPFQYEAFLFQEVNANIHITEWNNVRYATIVNGVLVPGALIPSPLPVEGGTPPPTAPAAPLITSFSPDTGLAGDGITNDSTPTLTGTAVANSTVTVFDGTTQVGTATANSSGAWTITTTKLADGSHSLTATDTVSGATSTASSALTVTVDTVAPKAPVETNASVVSGTTEVKLTGTAEANSTLHIFDGTTQIGTATASSTGAWSLTTGPLTAGSHSFTANATDEAGNASTNSAALGVTIAAAPTAPAAPTIVSFSPDSGVVGDHITDDNTLTLTGTAVANSTVTLFDGSAQIGTATANSSGSWSYITSVLTNAIHVLTATDTVSGVTSTASSPLSVTVDTVAPNAPVETGASIVSGTTEVKLTGTAEANSTLQVFDGTTQIGTATASSTGAWSLTTGALATGSHSFTADATDAAGNTSVASAALGVTIPPSTGAQNLLTNGGFETGNFSGWTLGGNYQPLSYGDQTYITTAAENGKYAAGLGSVGTDGTLSQNVATTAGQTYTIDFWLANQSSGPDDFSVSWNGQTLVALTNASAQGYTEYTFNVTGTAGTSHLEFDFRQDPSSWSLDNVSVTAAGSPSPAVTPTIASFSTDSGVVGDHITDDNTLALTGTAAANTTVTLFDGTTKLGTATVNSSGTWSYTTAALADGSHSFTATATNTAGTATSAAFTVTIDTVAPNAPVETGASIVSGTTEVQLTGTAEANSTLHIFDGTTQIGTATASSTGAWSLITDALATGSHSFTAEATDVAGNTSVASAALGVTIPASTGTQNLVTNGSFETGNFSGWTLGGNYQPLSYGDQTYITTAAENGKYAAGLGSVGTDGTLSQNVATTAGQTYTVDFWLANQSSGPDDFTASWNGQTLVALTNASAQGYTEYTFTVTGTAGTSHLEFDFRQDPSSWSLDNVSVTAAATTADSSVHANTASLAVAAGADTQAPAAPTMAVYSQDGTTAVAGTTTADDLLLKGTAEANSSVSVFDGGKQIGTTTTNGSGLWSFDTGHLSDGSHSFTSTATDVTGDVSAASATKAVTVDAPASTVDLTNVSESSQGIVTLTGTADASSKMEIFDGTKELGTTTANSAGAWSFTTSSAVSNTVHALTAQEIDSTGHTVATSGSAIIGSSGANTLTSTSGDDVFIGNGHQDTFVFAPNFGNDVIKDFKASGPSHDVLQFSQSVFDSFASVLAHATQSGTDVVIAPDAGNSLTLKNIKLTSLSAADFHFA